MTAKNQVVIPAEQAFDRVSAVDLLTNAPLQVAIEGALVMIVPTWSGYNQNQPLLSDSEPPRALALFHPLAVLQLAQPCEQTENR